MLYYYVCYNNMYWYKCEWKWKTKDGDMKQIMIDT